MMPRPRKTLVCPEATRYYHVVNRCVRRAFLCGDEYEHRRGRIEDLVLSLSKIFAIDVCAFAIMSNHYHLVVYLNLEQANAWSDLEVIERWHQLFKGTPVSQKYLRNGALTSAEQRLLQENLTIWRERLMDLSWFMRRLNETIAREANAEEGCTGRFWEGRYKSQALLDEKALAACMVYVDLNPIRSKMARTPEHSDHTSVKKRAATASTTGQPNRPSCQPKELKAFAGNIREDMPDGIPFKLTDYLELVDWTGRQIREGKRGSISGTQPPILNRLGIDTKQWMNSTSHFESRFKNFAGTVTSLKAACDQLNLTYRHGLSSCREAFG